MGTIVFGAVCPHGPIAVAETCTEDELALAPATREAYAELGRRSAAAGAETVVVATPHNVHLQGAMAVVLAGSHEGAVAGTDGRTVGLECTTDRELAALVLEALHDAGVPTVGVSYGGNRIEESAMPMDWGTLIPLWHLGGRADPPVPVVVVSPARDLSPEAHIGAGRAVAAAVARSDRRVAFVASADHGHRHSADGPYGYDDASAAYDGTVTAMVAENRLGDLVHLDPALVEAAAADSWWQLLMLHGVLGDTFESDLLSYEAPTYYGMLCAAFTPS
jgi:aromatic ring-opening dioxygenase LigB subunit